MNNHLAELVDRYPVLKDCAGDIERVFRIMEECFRSGGKVLLCGNGGSAADAEHWAGAFKDYLAEEKSIFGVDIPKIKNQVDMELMKELYGTSTSTGVKCPVCESKQIKEEVNNTR